MKKNDVVQFNTNHDWCGKLGIITSVKKLTSDTRYQVLIDTFSGEVYIYVLESENAIEFIGKVVYDKGCWRGAFDTTDALIFQLERGDYNE